MKIDGKPLSDLVIELDKKHFSYFRRTTNTNIDTSEFMSRLRKFALEKMIFGLTTGIQGAGKTTTMRKYFPKEMVVSVDYLAREYRKTRGKDDLKKALEYMELTGMIFPPEYFGLEEWIDKKIGEIIDEKLGKGKSLILDGIYPSRLMRSNEIKRAEKYNPYKIDFLFITPLGKVIKRILERQRHNSEKAVCILDLYRYLENFELPVDLETGLPENGLDLVIIFNDEKITHVYPKEELEKFDY